MSRAMNILVLQGGGALGAYQAGVFEALQAAGIEPDWVVGTSVGAINGALIAGNRREDSLARLKAFWARIAQPRYTRGAALASHEARTAKLMALTWGVPGFFRPRPPWLIPYNHDLWGVPPSFYDTTPLRETLEELVDFERLGTRDLHDGTRLSVGTVNIAKGSMRYFDSQHDTLHSAHILASGALPPGFPPVWIDGEAYWDGGLCSNTPMDYVVENEHLGSEMPINCYVVDLWSPEGPVPETITDAMLREKDIQYSTRAGHDLHFLKELNRQRQAIRMLGRHLTEEARQRPEIQQLLEQTQRSPVSIVRLLAPVRERETAQKDIDFSYATIMERWRMGQRDMTRALQVCPCRRDPISDDIGANVCSYRSRQDGELEDMTDTPYV